jgi:hypothetical protein
MAAPNGFNNNAFNNNTVSQAGVAIRHIPARTTLLAQAEAILRQPNQPIANVQGLAAATGVTTGQAILPNPLAYEEVLIFHPTIANYLSQIFCFAVRISPTLV